MEKKQVKLYSLIEMAGTNEYHLFVSEYTTCDPDVTGSSLCSHVSRKDSLRYVFYGENEDIARLRCALYGKNVCRECIKHLYGHGKKEISGSHIRPGADQV